MIIAIKYKGMGGKDLSQFYPDLQSFATSNFRIKVADSGTIYIDGDCNTSNYRLGDGTKGTYTKSEALSDYCNSNSFINHARNKGWSVYFIGKKII